MAMLKQSSALTGSMPPAAISTLVILAPPFSTAAPYAVDRPPTSLSSGSHRPNGAIIGRKFE
jgi:hypothetical protein